MKVRLATKFTGITVIFVLYVAVFFGWYLTKHETTLLTDQLQRRGVSIALGIANNCQYGVLTEDAQILSGFIRSASSERDVVYAEIISKDGKVLAHTEKDQIGRIRADLPAVSVGAKITSPRKDLYRIEVPIKLVPEEITPLGVTSAGEETIGYVRLGVTIENVNRELASIKQRIGVITMAIVACAFLAAFWISYRVARPLRALVAVTNKIAKGDLSEEVKPATSDEVGELALAFNQMTKDLKRSRDKIEEHSRMLEERVRERTRELEKANEELRQMQAQLIQSAKMTAIGELGAGVAHELNNPIGGILGYAQYISGKIDKGRLTDEEMAATKRQLELILRESQRCKTIVENLLSFSRKSMELKPLDIRKVIDDTLSLVSHQLALQNVKLVCSFDENLAQVEGNAGQLQQVFINIILNAQHAMPQGGMLTIAGKNIPGVNGAPKSVLISFADTGHGIAREHLPRVFEPFFTTKKDWKGTGLGLSVSYGIIQAHKGQITVESELGKGATFTVTLPALPVIKV